MLPLIMVACGLHWYVGGVECAGARNVIERMDEMPDCPLVDPHGDPIPDPEGVLEPGPQDTLLTCPVHVPMMISRAMDQDPDFLRFVERRGLKPGGIVEVENRDSAADGVRLRGRNNRVLTTGARAAIKVLVHAGAAIAAFLLLAGAALAQTATPAPAPPPAGAPFEILDNSFLVEEAFNQERGIFQNIFGFTRQGGDWQLAFTQEWPAPGMRHQLSYTLSAESVASHAGFGDVMLNYRFQALEEGPGRPAFSPRFSAIVPSGQRSAGGGDGGIQVNLPFSKQRRDFYFHWNAGFTWLPRGARADLLSPAVAGSAIYRLRPMLNLMLESVVSFDAADVASGVVRRTRSVTLSPGVRGGWTVAKDTQVIIGAAMPMTRTAGETSTGVFGYFSYELPFKK